MVLKFSEGLTPLNIGITIFWGHKRNTGPPFIKLGNISGLGPVAFTGFIEAGQVTRNLSETDMHEFVYSTGLGFRYCAAPAEKVNIRADLAYVDRGLSLTLGIEEAF